MRAATGTRLRFTLLGASLLAVGVASGSFLLRPQIRANGPGASPPVLGVIGLLSGALLFWFALRRGSTADAPQLNDSGDRRYKEILGIVGHDLRSPVHSIRLGTSFLLRHGTLGPRDHQVVTRIASSADRMGRLIAELRDFSVSQMPTGLRVNRRRVDFGSLCREVLDELEEGFPSRRMRLLVESDATGEWDPDRLAQVVSNLVGNALFYSPPETEVTVRLSSDEKQTALEVHNLGTAIPPEVLPKVFEAFSRGAASQLAHSHGLGLGLYICRQIVFTHGGKISVSSTAENGTTFTVTLPRHLEMTAARSPSEVRAF